MEIRDRNNLPVAGATVTFSITGQGASFGGLSTLTVTTNAAGQAAAVGFTPTAAGAIQINASALVQGQALTATITQTNVMTAAQAVGAAGATGAGGGAGGSGAATGGAAAGGGISGTTIGIVGAAAAAVGGGALIATQDTGSDSSSATAGASQPRQFRGAFSSTILLTFQGCTRLESWAGTLEIVMRSVNPLAGDARILDGRTRVESVTCSGGPQVGATGNLPMPSTPITGSAASIEFRWEASNAFGGAGTGEAPGTNTNGHTFSGTFDGTVISGTLQHYRRIESSGAVPGTGSASTQVTLRQ
ncbi:MAG: Ig-like domain-containing protein [Acidimicrobiia bacterium]